MIRKYFVFIIRNFYKRKIYTFLNVLGLAIGIASFLVIYLYISNELSYDKHHKEANHIFRLVNVYDFNGVGENSASSPFPVAFTMLQEYPDMIENTVRLFNFQAPASFIEYGENKYNEKLFFFADSTYFSIFDHSFLSGNPSTALSESGSVVISHTAAQKYFGDENPVGKVIRFENRLQLKITAVIEDVPVESHFRFDFLASMSSIRQVFGGQLPQTWVWNPCWTYFLLDPNLDPKSLENQFPDFIQKYFTDAEKENVSLYLQPLTDIHLKSKLDYELAPNGSMNSVYILSAIAVFLLIIAMINYMNLATATSAGRTKEVGIKKLSGANRMKLVVEYIGESVLITFIALAFALVAIEFILPYFNSFTGKQFEFNDVVQTENVLLVVFLGFLIGTLSGIYPALYLSSFKPIEILSGSLKMGVKSGLPRKFLVVLQFTISICLIIGTIIVNKQLKYMRNADLGFSKENILVLPINRTPLTEAYKSFKNEILQNPRIHSVTAMDDIFGASHNTHEFRPEGFPEDKWQFYPAIVVQHDFIKTMNMKIVAGRDYNESNKADPESGILINEAMVRHLGWGAPKEAIGKKFRSLNGNERVIGVFNDFHQTSLHEAAGPFVLNMKENKDEIMWFLKFMAIKIDETNQQSVIEYLETKWKEIAPGRPFEYFFLEEKLAALYSDEENLGKLTFLFTLIILFIASLGLIGLAAYMAEKRTREIGIRKVLGATTMNLIRVQITEFVLLVLLSSLLAWILSWVVMNHWLARFPYQTGMNWAVFVLAALFANILAVIISGLQALYASYTNPVETLKHE